MAEELLYINNVLIELPEKSIARTLQVSDLSKLATRQSSFSNNIKIPRTPNNILAFEMLGLTGNGSLLPYDELEIKYVVDGIELVEGGKGIVKKTDIFYNLVIYDGIISLSDLIGDAKISELDFTAYNHNLNRTNYFASFLNNDGYIYGIAQFDSVSASAVNIDLQSPSFYTHTLMDMIFASIGKTKTGDIFTDAVYKEEVISTYEGYDRTLSGNDIPIDFSLLFGEVKQIDFFKDVLQRYGLMFRRTPNSDAYDFIKYKDLLKTTLNTEDWSDKSPKFLSETYTSGFAQTNRLKFEYDETDSQDVSVFADGILTVVNKNIPIEKTLYKSVFKATKDAFFGAIGSAYQLFHWVRDDLNIVSNEDGLRVFKIVRTSKSLLYDFIGDGLGLVSSNNNTPYLSFDGINYADKVLENYEEINKMFAVFRKVVIECNLSVADIYNIDFFKLKFFKQFGKYYYINKVSSFKKNKPTKVEFIEIAEIEPSILLSDLTSFSMTVGVTEFNVCAEVVVDTFYHNGAGARPVVDDLVYEDVGGGEGELLNGQNLFRKMTNGDYIQINNVGKVLSVDTCTVVLLSSLTSFSAGNGTLIYSQACGIGTPNTLYHDGAMAQPEQNDLIYEASGLNGVLFNGEDKFFELTDGTFMAISTVGLATHIITCGDKLIEDLTSVGLSNGKVTALLACAEVLVTETNYHDGSNPDPINSDIIYEDIGSGIGSPRSGGALFFKVVASNFSIKISVAGLVSDKANC